MIRLAAVLLVALSLAGCPPKIPMVEGQIPQEEVRESDSTAMRMLINELNRTRNEWKRTSLREDIVDLGKAEARGSKVVEVEFS